jgi:hypothetical protein
VVTDPTLVPDRIRLASRARLQDQEITLLEEIDDNWFRVLGQRLYPASLKFSVHLLKLTFNTFDSRRTASELWSKINKLQAAKFGMRFARS